MLETQNDKEGSGSRRKKLWVRRRAGDAGSRSTVRQEGQDMQEKEAQG